MKTRLLATSALVVGMTLLALLAMHWTQPAVAAQSQPASAGTTGPLPKSDVPVEALQSAPGPDRAQASTALQGLPLMFIENIGQFDADARFQVRRGNTTIYLADDALWFTVLEGGSEEQRAQRGVNVKLSFPGANPHPRLEPFDRLDTHVSYFVGSDSANWRTDVPAWGGVRYADLYPGVDLEITGERGSWAWRLVRHAYATVPDVRLHIAGANQVRSDDQRLLLTTAVGQLALPLLTTEGLAPEAGAIIVSSGHKAFDVIAPFRSPAPCDALQPQDEPDDLVYSTYLGGLGDDQGWDIAVDLNGNAYVTGKTYSTDFSSTLTFSTTQAGNGDVFVVKVNPTGTDLTYAAFVGGSSDDNAWAVDVDETGHAYVTGWTASSDFPTTTLAFDTHFNGVNDAFVVKLNAAGTDLAYATFLGGSHIDWGHGIAVDGTHHAYVTGLTWSTDFPTTTLAFDTRLDGLWDAFVVKLNADGSDLAYASFMGGSDQDEGQSIDVDGAGNAYVTGMTASSDFITTTLAFDTSHNGSDDAFVVKVNPSGTGLAYASFIGGSNMDTGYDIVVDQEDQIYLVGRTDSSDFPATASAFDTSLGGLQDAFVASMNLDGAGQNDLVYATFLGGSDIEDWVSVTVDGNDHAYVTGNTHSADFPTTASAFDTSLGVAPDAYVVKMNADGTDLVYASFLGGSGADGGWGIAVDGAGDAYLTGITDSGDFPTTTLAFSTDYNGGPGDAFVTKLAIGNGSGPTLTPTVDLSQASYSVDEDGGSAMITVVLSPVATQTVTVDYATADGTATAPDDYASTNGTLTFSVGATSRTFDVPIVDDAGDEGDENLTLTLSDANNAILGSANNPATLTIVDDEAGPTPPPTSTLKPLPFYSTFLGGGGDDYGTDIAVDDDGDAYILGPTASSDFPASSGAFSETLNGEQDTFVAKVHPAGDGTNDLVYATYLGGSGGDAAGGIAVDDSENVYVTGWSNSFFPDTDGSFASCEGGGAFLAKLNDTGSGLLYAGCIAGFNAEGQDLALDSAGQAYVSGKTGGGFPATSGAYQETYGGGAFDAFLAIISADGVTLTYATYVGGNDNECSGSPSGCTLDLYNDSDVYLAGDTESPNFPTKNAYDATCGTDGECDPLGGYRDAFLVKLAPQGNGAADLLYATFIGHSGGDVAAGVAVDEAGNAYLTGHTASHEFPVTAGAYDKDFNGGNLDAFLLKLDPAAGASGLRYATFLGGSSPGDKGLGIAVDQSGNAYAVGTTNSTGFPTTADGYDTSLGGNVDAFVVKLNPAGNGQADLLYATFLGGDNGTETGYALAVDGGENVYVTGETNADDFPTSTNPFDTSYNGGTHDAFFVRLPTAKQQIYLPLILRSY